MARIAINGLGRIGRAFLKLALKRPELEVVAVNDLADPENLVYLLRFDSAYGRYDQPVRFDKDKEPALVIGNNRIRFFQQRDPVQLPWKALDIDIVVEATGVFESFEKARVHVKAGARRVVLSAPANDADGPDARTALVGINLDALEAATLSSNASCTTNSASPVMQVLQETIGVRKAFLMTVHAYTATQNLIDGPVKGRDLRRGRAAAANIVPSTTGAATAVARAIPALQGRFDGVSMRVTGAGGINFRDRLRLGPTHQRRGNQRPSRNRRSHRTVASSAGRHARSNRQLRHRGRFTCGDCGPVVDQGRGWRFLLGLQLVRQ